MPDGIHLVLWAFAAGCFAGAAFASFCIALRLVMYLAWVFKPWFEAKLRAKVKQTSLDGSPDGDFPTPESAYQPQNWRH